MAATFLLVRHAAHGHLGRVLSGRMPGIALSDEGRDQAARLGRKLAGRGLRSVQTSPVQRARETATAIAAAAGVAVEEVPALDEIDFGDWTGQGFADLDGDPDWFRWNTQRSGARPPAGESMMEAQARIVGHLRRVATAQPDATIAIVSHCDMIRATVAAVLGTSLDDLLRFSVDPASVTRVRISEDGRDDHLITLNDRIDD